MVTLQLTDEQVEDLQEILSSARDEGPEGEGWASNELTELRALVNQAISIQKRRYHQIKAFYDGAQRLRSSSCGE